MEDKFKLEMRELLIDRFGLDINTAKSFFSTQNYAFVFPDKPDMIRVGIGSKKSRGDVISELLWIDDLKAFKNTVCEPYPSLKGNIIEEFEIDGVVYRASHFRKAQGTVQLATKMTPMFFICVGELLGMVHKVSTDESEIGMKFKRAKFSDTFEMAKKEAEEFLDSSMKEKIEKLQNKVDSLPELIGTYGICHGDFHINNFFVDDNNIWLFDFDSCTYANYMYDIASFLQSCFLYAFGAGKDCRKVLQEDMMPYFRYGYELNHKCSEEFWNYLELFMSYRTAYTYLKLTKIHKFGLDDNLDRMKAFFSYIVSKDDPLDAMTEAMKGMIK